MNYNWTAFRAKFPALEGKAYLNTAGGGVMASQVAEAGIRYFEESVRDGDINWGKWLDRSEQDRGSVAQFIGARPEAVSFLQNASLGINVVARSMPQRSRVLAIQPEFPSCTTPFIRADHDVRFMETPASGYVDAGMVRKALENTKVDLFVLSSVQFANGFRADLSEIGRACRESGVLFLVDATQSIGAFDLDMERDAIDALAFSGYKWATAGYGNAVLATGSRWPVQLPPLVGWRSAVNAYDLENDRLDLVPTGIGHEMGHPPFPGIFTMGEALRLLAEPPAGEIGKRIVHLSERVRSGLGELGISVRSCPEGRHVSGITLAELEDAPRIKGLLQEKNIWVTARQGGLRISVHAYNSADDIDWLLRELKTVRSA